MRITLGRGDNLDDAGPNSGYATTLLFVLLLIPGVFATLAALSAFTLLNSRLAMGPMIGIFLLPATVQVLAAAMRRFSLRRWVRGVYVACAIALVGLGVLLFLNGGLDSAPANEVITTVEKKTVSHGRHGATQYDLMVGPLMPGGTSTRLNVTQSAYEHARVGQPFTVELHKGFFGLAWYRAR